MSVSVRYDVIIAGGGMVGLTLGIALAGEGVNTAVIDREPPEAMRRHDFDGRVSAVAAGCRRLLEHLGAWQGMAPFAGPILEIRVADQDSPAYVHYDYDEIGEEPLGHIVENRHIRMALLDRAKELPLLDLLTPFEITNSEVDGGQAQVTLSDGRRLTGSLLVAAEGRQSPLRERHGIALRQFPYGQDAIVATIAHEVPHGCIAVEWFRPAGPFAFLPMACRYDPATKELREDGDRGWWCSSIVWTEDPHLAAEAMDVSEELFLREVDHRLEGIYGELALVGRRWRYPLSLQYADAFTAERLALIGDAGHAIHPIAGQGVNLGWRDAAVLAELIIDRVRLGLDPGSAGVLADYERRRRFDVTSMVGITDGINRLFSNRNPLLRLARNAGFAAVQHTPPLRRFFMKHAMGVVGPLPRLMRAA